MQILITDTTKGRLPHLSNGWGIITMVTLAVVSLMGSAGYAGFYLGAEGDEELELHSDSRNQLFTSQSLTEEIDVQKLQINMAVLDAQEHLNALAMRLGSVQAKVTRLEAASARLSTHAGIEAEEFNFAQQPALGGVLDPAEQQEFNVPDFIQSLETLSVRLDEHREKINMLDSIMLIDNLENAAVPSGKPVTVGWISSGFGKRTDPLSGKHDVHKGLDFAGPKGTKIYAVARGVVTWSGKQTGYGNIIEIDHGQGYVTRYAHNEKNLVKVGDKVEKGQKIALMGSTGRSTGTHVHFEVEQNGKAVDPKPYLAPMG